MFRGKRVLRAGAWLAVDSQGEPVAFVGGEVYDRWVYDWDTYLAPDRIART